ncbi:MAG: hypothetical protein GY799_01500 [Desulfobulbaceae bacterium]|nr:hypothetical protein [Desulfobulbaceae bacterium]
MVRAVLASRYVALFIKVFPDTASANVYETYDNIGVAIAAFERSHIVTRFSSTFDQFEGL